jgi:uncharacterized membrane protein YkoI
MWQWIRIATFGLLGLVAVGGARADEEKVPLDKVPAAVMNAVKKKFPAAKIEEAAKEVEDGKTTYEIGIEQDEHDVTVSLEEDGTILEIERELAVKDLPSAVTSSITAKYPRATLKKAEEVTEGDKVTYEVIVVPESKKAREVVLDRSGKILEDAEKKEGDD